MKTDGTCGVMVTYFPDFSVRENIEKIRPQLEALVVVDNGSGIEELVRLRRACGEMDYTLIEIGENKGIAAALNIGVQCAMARGFELVALLDQDSTASEGMIEMMVRRYRACSGAGRIAVVMPKHIEKSSGAWLRPALAADGGPLTAITSGSLMPRQVFEACGEFEEDLFIDCVDHEYCLRARSLGFTLALCEEARLHHAVGAPAWRRALGIRRLRTLDHNPERRYYIARNHMVLFARYWRRFPRWCWIELVSWFRDAIKVVLVEDDRRLKMSMMARGIADGVRGRLGPLRLT